MKIEKKYETSRSCEILFNAWISPDMTIDPVTRIVSNPVAGGQFVLTTGSGPKASRMNGVFLEVERPNRIRYSWCWEGTPEETIVTVTFSPSASGCEVRVVHEGFSFQESADRHAAGWDYYVAALLKKLEQEGD